MLVSIMTALVGMVALALLGGLALWAVTGADSLLETLERHARSRDFWLLAQQQWTVGALLVISLGLVGAGALTHIRETAAVSFRVLGLAAAPTLTMFFGAGTIGATQATFATFPFWFIATTSPLPLQRREIALVPNNPRSALRHAPILPGCGRGILYTLTMAAILVAFGLATHVPFHGALPSANELLHLSAAVGLMCAWGTGIAIRRMRAYEQSRTTTSEARARIPALLFFAIFMGAMFDGIFAYNTKIGVFLVSTFNPVVLLAQPDVLLPLPLVNVMVWVAALMLLWSARDLIAFSLAELRSPGRVPVPNRYRGAGGATGEDSGTRRRRRVPLSQRRR